MEIGGLMLVHKGSSITANLSRIRLRTISLRCILIVSSEISLGFYRSRLPVVLTNSVICECRIHKINSCVSFQVRLGLPRSLLPVVLNNSTIYGTYTRNAAFTRALQYSLSRVELIQILVLISISLWYIPILLSHQHLGLPVVLTESMVYGNKMSNAAFTSTL